MKKSICIRIPNEKIYIPQVIEFIKRALQVAGVSEKSTIDMIDATRELLFNAVNHAYPAQYQGAIDIDLSFLYSGVEISIHDMGFPFDFKSHMSSHKEGGLRRLKRHVDRLSFTNMGKKGKSFTIYKKHPLNIENRVFYPYSDLEDESPSSLKPASIQIRDFEPSDEEAISRLIYNNYTYSYYKSLFYYPKKILALNETDKIGSVVAETKEKEIVGHFALIKVPNSNSAEIGVAVVRPDYKGKGIMNSMLSRIIQRAKEAKFNAIFGEALMLHPFSQRANLHHGFAESALLLGIVPNSVSLTDPNAIRSKKRAPVLVAYKVLNGKKIRTVFIPEVYAEIVERVYENNGLEILKREKTENRGQNRMDIELSRYTRTGTLVIDSLAENFSRQVRTCLRSLYRKHVEMIYVDINMVSCEKIDEAVNMLKEEGFVFAGILLYRRAEFDYLRMQMPNSDNIDTGEQIVCHSDFCKELLSIISAELYDSSFF